VTARQSSVHRETAREVVGSAVTVDSEEMATWPATFNQLLTVSRARLSTDLLTDVTAGQHLGARHLTDEI